MYTPELALVSHRESTCRLSEFLHKDVYHMCECLFATLQRTSNLYCDHSVAPGSGKSI